MSVTSLLIPVFVEVALTFVLMVWMWSQRVKALKSGEVKFSDIDLRQPGWPKRATQIANSYHNQLEVPLLFYVLIALVLITRVTSVLLVVLAWAFVATRLVHAYIHTGSNDVRSRFQAMMAGVIILGAMWVIFAVHIFAVVS